MEEMLFCPSCMAKAESPDGVCPVCGGDMHIENQSHQLPARMPRGSATFQIGKTSLPSAQAIPTASV